MKKPGNVPLVVEIGGGSQVLTINHELKPIN